MADKNNNDSNELIIHENPLISSRELMKLKMKDDAVEIHYAEYAEIPGIENLQMSEVVRNCHYLPHNDFRFSLSMFVPHLLMINEIFFVDDIEKSEIFSQQTSGEIAIISDKTKAYLDKHFVSGIVVSGEDEHRGVTIIGGKRLKGNKVLNLITPFVKFQDENYSYGMELKGCLTYLEKECWAYLNGKSSQGKQLDMFEKAEIKVAHDLKKAGVDVKAIGIEIGSKKKSSKNVIEDNNGSVI